ncbi:YeeE/YedE family protein [Hoeflea alexandrii]|uniref:YeeE/YedE family protein n=1 Tax=Hoeflea alexandrii TaxID=288436 RepID=A0ABT1CNE1_9HYPH|nr:YeeE/YedE family protein [Hoeflea alexandrii]MCO6407695.1 YeeE/YedE family protein [Hoeflea alexandrii]
MNLEFLADHFGDNFALLIGGAVIGAIFGAFAQQSRFCLRAAAIEFSRGHVGGKVAIWLIVFSTAIAGTMLLSAFDLFTATEARQLASPQSLSGAAIGGLMFGTGMVLARGCSSRLLVLSATGNLRALLSGLVFAVVAQASLHGFLSPLREALATPLTTLSIGSNDLLVLSSVSEQTALGLVLAGLAASLFLALWRKVGIWKTTASFAVGACIPLAWWFTNAMTSIAFEPVQLESLSFTGPSADTLMLFLSSPGSMIDFDVGLVPGVFIGAFLAAWVTGELELQGFEGGGSMRRYLAGAALMGFGGMLAGGCAVGAGVTGASIFALTAWVTLFAIWIAAAVTDWVVDRKMAGRTVPPQALAASPDARGSELQPGI